MTKVKRAIRENKSEHLHMRITPTMKEAIARAADRLNMPQSVVVELALIGDPDIARYLND